ncbi:MAG: tRNA pseudouridine(55) synthase TruB [Sedimentibacter sp.]|uniref:tRNA pseudouridine(55) synthase TruB n=1 Tax=Sedimentibacter sp. TaxID=1960295 RepID=UPI002981C33F|nr:tRNA pseudouridine(55) synthase TruB [Sedimentibacter sp.]MDW5300699.1 tRNA pseudouridine(55) synthase TruB [Sedimentibacter sp.]
MNGILNILKPTGMTSHDVVSSVRKILDMKKVGHAGTLDPNVAGVLVICVGKGTKLSEYLMNGDKTYICELILGQSTDTQDSYGKMVKKTDNVHVNYEDLIKTLKEFEGEQLQVPPAYSAVKLNGKKLYEYARQNIVVEKPGKTVYIKELKLLKYEGERVLLQVKCSKGTYMRTLCNDIGERLGTLGYMGVLVRTEAKGLHIENSVTLEELKFLKDNNRLYGCLIPIDKIYVLDHIIVDEINYERLIAGNEVSSNTSALTSEEFYIYSKNKLVGIGRKVRENMIKVEKMLM